MPKFRFENERYNIQHELRVLGKAHAQIVELVDRLEDELDVEITMHYFVISESVLFIGIDEYKPVPTDYEEFFDLATVIAQWFDYEFTDRMNHSPLNDDIDKRAPDKWNLSFREDKGVFIFDGRYTIDHNLVIEIEMASPYLPPEIEHVGRNRLGRYFYQLDEGQNELDFEGE